MGGILLASGSVTANHCKAVLSGHLYSVTKHFFPHGSSLFEDDSTPFPMAKVFTEWFESLAGAVEAFEPTALLITIIETVQISLDELSSISQVECRVSTDVHANCSDVNTKLRRCMYVFLLICHPFFKNWPGFLCLGFDVH